MEDCSCIQFYVTKKIELTELKNPLPRFVFGRTKDGALDYSTKVLTDVIALENLHLCDRSGANIAGNGDSGTIAFFTLDANDETRVIAITCSHVVSHLDAQVSPHLQFSGGTVQTFIEARVIWNSVLDEDDVLDFDLAYLDVTFATQPITPRQISDVGQVLTGALETERIEQGMELEAVIQDGGRISLTVDSKLSSVNDIDTTGATGVTRKISINNLFLCKSDTGVNKGDSGGLVHDGDKVVGIVVAKADDGFVLFHPIERILQLGNNSSGIQLMMK